MTAPGTECRVTTVELRVTQELDLACVPDVGDTFDRLLSLRPGHLVVDLSGCRHIDAAGIGLLLDAHRRLARRHAVLSLREPDPRIRRILQITGVDRLLPLAPAQRHAGGPARSGPSAPPAHLTGRSTPACATAEAQP
jgi:anti-anti-sigma factor